MFISTRSLFSRKPYGTHFQVHRFPASRMQLSTFTSVCAPINTCVHDGISFHLSTHCQKIPLLSTPRGDTRRPLNQVSWRCAVPQARHPAFRTCRASRMNECMSVFVQLDLRRVMYDRACEFSLCHVNHLPATRVKILP